MASGDFDGFDQWGFPIITDWNKTYITDPADEDENNRAVNVITPVYVASDGVTPINHLTTAEGFGGQDPSRIAEAFKKYQNLLQYKCFIASPCPAYHTAFRPQGVKSINFAERFSLYGSISGNVLTVALTHDGCADPRHIEFMKSYTPAWETGGDPVYFYNGSGITPGWEVRPIADSLDKRALIKRIIGLDVEHNTMRLELSCDLGNVPEGLISVWCQMHDPPKWTYVMPARPLWSTRHKTAWISVTDLGDDQTIELLDKLGASCRISYPLTDSPGRYAGTFKIIASDSETVPDEQDEIGVDITGFYCLKTQYTEQFVVKSGFSPRLYMSKNGGDAVGTFVVLDIRYLPNPPYFGDHSFPGTVLGGNIDIHNRPIVYIDGNIATVHSVSYEEDGIEVLIPTVLANPPRIVSGEEAWEHYQNTGEHLGKFVSVDTANAYAEWLHLEQQSFYASIRLFKHFRIYYCPETPVPDESDPDTSARGLKSCYHNKRDWTESMGNTGLSFTAKDAEQRHWYCAAAHAGADLSEYDAECSNTRCPYWLSVSETGGWSFNINDWKKIWLGKNLYYVQVMAGNPTVIIGRGEGGVPSITWLAGQPIYYMTGLDVNKQSYADGNCIGWMDTSTTPYYTLRLGAIGENGSGVLAQADIPLPADPLGNTLEDGTDYALLLKDWSGWRNPGYTPPSPLSGFAGWTDKYVQRMVFKTFTIRSINLSDLKVNSIQRLNGHLVMHVKDETKDQIVVQLNREVDSTFYFANYNGALPGIQEQAKYIYKAEWDGDVVTLQMSPGVDFWMTRYASGAYMVTGMTAHIPEHEKSRNYAASNFNSCFGMMDRARKGVTLKIENAPGALADIGGMVIQAQARGGDLYDGGPLGAAGEKTIQFTAAGAWRPYLYESGNENPILWTLSYVKFGHDLSVYYAVENIAFGNFDVSEGVPAHMVNSWNGVWLMPSLESMAAAIIQYILTDDIGKVQMEIGYRYQGDTEDRVAYSIPMYSYVEVGAPFVSVPCVVLPGVPDLTVAPIIEWNNFVDNGWTVAPLICDGMFTNEEARSILPAHGHYRIFRYNGATCLVLPVEYWGYSIQFTATYLASELVYPETDPTGAPGVPDLGENRLRMDVLRVWFGGFLGQQVKEWMQSFTPFPPLTYKIRIEETAVMPPEVYYNEEGEKVEHEPDLHLYHVEYSGDATVTNGGGLGEPVEPVAYDRTNGVFIFDSSEWDETKNHGIRFEITAFLESYYHLIPKEVVEYPLESIRALKWFSIGSVGNAWVSSLGVIDPNYPDDGVSAPWWGIDDTSLPVSWSGRTNLRIIHPYSTVYETRYVIHIPEPGWVYGCGVRRIQWTPTPNPGHYDWTALNNTAFVELPNLTETISKYIDAVKIDVTITDAVITERWSKIIGFDEEDNPIWDTGSEEVGEIQLSARIGVLTIDDNEITSLEEIARAETPTTFTEIEPGVHGGSIIVDSGTFSHDLAENQYFVAWLVGPMTSVTEGADDIFDSWTIVNTGTMNEDYTFSSYDWRARELVYTAAVFNNVAVRFDNTKVETDAIETVDGNFPVLMEPS